MTADMDASMRASRYRVPRSRGAMSGFLLMLLGAWAALVPFFGPYIDLAYTPAVNDAWHWTAGRGWLEVTPGCAVFLGGLLLVVSASRVVASFGGWLAAAGGAWLIVGPVLADVANISLGTPDPSSSTNVQALESLLFFYGVGAVIVFLSGLGLGRLSVRSVRDVRAAERRLAEEQAATTPFFGDEGAPGYPAAPGYTPAPATRGSQQTEPTRTTGLGRLFGKHHRAEEDEDAAETTSYQTSPPRREDE
jgi:hypothetical protein